MFSKLGPITFAEVVGQMANTLLTFGQLEIARSHCCTIKRLKQEFLLLMWQVAVINCFQETQCHSGIQVATFQFLHQGIVHSLQNAGSTFPFPQFFEVLDFLNQVLQSPLSHCKVNAQLWRLQQRQCASQRLHQSKAMC